MINGQINYINFKGCIGSEINNIHLGVLFNVPHIKELVFCIPLTSPKIKHFKTIDDFNNRNHKNMKYFNFQYLKQTDSIALLDQMKIISINRILTPFEDSNNTHIILDDKNLKILKLKIYQYIKYMLEN